MARLLKVVWCVALAPLAMNLCEFGKLATHTVLVSQLAHSQAVADVSVRPGQPSSQAKNSPQNERTVPCAQDGLVLHNMCTHRNQSSTGVVAQW
jgi:hypothetical protein